MLLKVTFPQIKAFIQQVNFKWKRDIYFINIYTGFHKSRTLKQLKVLKDNEFIDNKLYYYLKPTDSPAPRFYGQPKIHKSGVQTGNIAMPRILLRFPTTSEMFPLKMMR